MKKILALIIPVLCILLGIGIYLKNARELTFIDNYFDTSFKDETNTVLSEKHFPGRDFGYIYTVKTDDYLPDGVFDLKNYEDGYSDDVRDLIRLMGEELPSGEVKSIFFHNIPMGHRMALVYDIVTEEYTIYFQTF